MPIFGAATQKNLQRTIHNCGLLRSRDGGKTWGDFSWIARGARPVIGAASESRFSFEGPSLAVLPDGRWLAMVSARRLNKSAHGPSPVNAGPGSPHVLCRLWSSDQGRTWTKPEQLMPGAWPATVTVGKHTLLANTLWAAWGEMRLEVSDDGFASIFQELPMMSRGWLIGRTNNPRETPPPPLIPYLADDWPFEHYGFPSIEVLDQDNVVVVFGRTQWGTPSYHEFDPPEWDNIPVEKEKIQAIFYRREKDRRTGLHPVPDSDQRGASVPETRPTVKQERRRGRWVMSERITVPNLGGPMAQLPAGDLIAKVGDAIHRSSDGGRTWKKIEEAELPEKLAALGVLKSGRWLAATMKVNQQWRGGGEINVGTQGGYPVRKSKKDQSYDAEIVVRYSDDEGKSWQAAQPFKGPFKWAIPSVNHFIQSPDGTVALPIFGCVTDQEMSSYSASNGVIRSKDRGRTWGDFSFVFRTNPKGPNDYQPEPRYSEMDVAQLPNGHCVAYSRNERIGAGPNGMGATSIAVSTDFGRNWKKTGASLVGVSQQKGVVLPDGGIALTYRTHSWQVPGVAITYDKGRSFDYLLDRSV